MNGLVSTINSVLFLCITDALYIGKDIKAVTEWVTVREVQKWAENTLGEEVVVNEIDDAAWHAWKNPKTEEIWLNIQLFYTAGPGYRDLELSHRLLPGARKLEDLIQEWGKSLVN